MTAALSASDEVDAAAFARGFEVGVNAGLAVGYQQGWDAHVNYVQQRLGLTMAVLDEPTRDELAKARAVDHKQCPSRCRARGRPECSRCIHAWAYYERGGRDYFGMETERQLAAARPDAA